MNELKKIVQDMRRTDGGLVAVQYWADRLEALSQTHVLVSRGVEEDEDAYPVGFADWYNRHFALREANTQHLADCEDAWRAALLKGVGSERL